MENTAIGRAKSIDRQASTFCFVVYIYFICDFFLHLSARIHFYGQLRPTLLLVMIISISLFLQRDILAGRGKNKVFKTITILIVYIFVSVPVVEWPGSVLKNNIPEFVKAVIFLFFTALIIDSEKRLKILLVAFVSCQVFRILEPLYLNVTTGYWGSSTYLGGGEFAERLAGAPSDVINPNELGFVIATSVPFLYYFLWLGNAKGKLLFTVLMPLVLYALVLTMSRGAMLALLVVMFMIFKQSKNKVLLIVVALVAVVSLWSVMSPNQKDRYMSLVDSDTQGAASVQGRFTGMFTEFSLGLQRPIFGHGLGTTAETKFNVLGHRQVSHNLYAELLVELGLIGSIIFLMYIKSVYETFRINHRLLQDMESRDQFYLKLNMALSALFWMYVVYSVNYWGLSVYYWYFIGGLAIAFNRLMLEEKSSSVSIQKKGVWNSRPNGGLAR